MYAKINLQRRVLISPVEVINNIASDDSLPVVKVLHSIVVAEERFVRPFLGYDMYETFLAAKNKTVDASNQASLSQKVQGITVGDIVNAAEFLDTDQVKLWNEHLCKFIAECVKYVAMPESFADFTTSGIMKNNPAVPVIGDDSAKAASVSLNEVKWLMDKWVNERLEPLKQAMHTFICRYNSKYPGYAQPCGCKDKVPAAAPKTSYVFVDVYGDEEEDYMPQPTVPVQVPAQAPTVFSLQWVTTPGQTEYPYPGQFNEDTMLQQLKGATIISITQEGYTMFIGNGYGEAVGIDPVTGRISWNTPAPDQEQGLRMTAMLSK